MRGFFLIAAVLFAAGTHAASNATYACASYPTQPLGSTICTGGTYGICSSAWNASAIVQSLATNLAAEMTALTVASQAALGTTGCALIGGLLGEAWTDPAFVCPLVPWCDTASCNAVTGYIPQGDGSTSSSGSISDGDGATPIYCCSSMRDFISNYCVVSGLETVIYPGANLTQTVGAMGITYLGQTLVLNSCQDINCVPVGAASQQQWRCSAWWSLLLSSSVAIVMMWWL